MCASLYMDLGEQLKILDLKAVISPIGENLIWFVPRYARRLSHPFQRRISFFLAVGRVHFRLGKSNDIDQFVSFTCRGIVIELQIAIRIIFVVVNWLWFVLRESCIDIPELPFLKVTGQHLSIDSHQRLIYQRESWISQLTKYGDAAVNNWLDAYMGRGSYTSPDGFLRE